MYRNTIDCVHIDHKEWCTVNLCLKSTTKNDKYDK